MRQRRITGLLAGLALACLAGGLAPMARAQVAVFDPDDYGKADLPLHESTGDAKAFIAAQEGVFEPIRELPADDLIRRISSAVGRIDLLNQAPDGRRSLVTCTGALLPLGWVVTNHHCIPEEGDRKLLSASILLGYLVQGGEGAQRYPLSVDPADWHDVLDFSLVRLLEPPDPRFATLVLRHVAVDPGDPLIVVHHPLGRPQVMTRFRCFTAREQADGPMLRHRCDTLPGSSGSILFTREMQPVALHHSGGMTANDAKSFNESTLFSAILGQSELLRELSGAEGGTSAPVPDQAADPATETGTSGESGMSAEKATDLLRGN